MRHHFDFSGENGRLDLGGDLTIDDASKLLTIIDEAQSSAHNLLVTLENVTEVHLSCLQLLCSAHRSALQVDKNFSLGEFSPEFRQAAQDAGYTGHTRCSFGLCDKCMWAR